MNKKLSSVGVSFTLHLVLAALAFNTVIYTFAPPKLGSSPLYVHVRVDKKLLSSPKAHEGKKVSQRTHLQPQENPTAPKSDQELQNVPVQRAVT